MIYGSMVGRLKAGRGRNPPGCDSCLADLFTYITA